ncbi:small acid-soluble spore protein SspI [Sporolactobacillus inulinus]|jgi:small acid-soluble spore protein I (minor)|uniref:Small, acid-soluble spore protein I n=2 Tax=Sporolactobacillus inulinus TaxID=2078 RepID=A0A4Y1Z7R4_9BACL|nr:small acid-soluble spore protein SspI [Sporolactobacillus inulinus]KLI01467.1 small acid-soluble spore protein SspI [Sporolactobacillus inulinus CASD]GAY75025.1 small, acid-soluble spore protein I [Sporolactobacillus inulinus]GEB75684.1 small, acid-soluble spore protein I [Sporolactobacillus inulinus]
MDLDIRRAVLHNLSGNNKQQLQDTVIDAIQNGQEKMLPGLGVLFEVIWNKADSSFRDQMLTRLEQGV